jgi:hypothetical protein
LEETRTEQIKTSTQPSPNPALQVTTNRLHTKTEYALDESVVVAPTEKKD